MNSPPGKSNKIAAWLAQAPSPSGRGLGRGDQTSPPSRVLLCKAFLFVSITACHLVLYASDIPTAEQGRTAIGLDQSERALVLAEMRAFLQSVQLIIQSLSTKDLPAAAAAARQVGVAAAAKVPDSLKEKLPMGFKNLGHTTHLAFDELALDAEQLGDPDHTLAQLATLLGNCVGCHAAFRFGTGP